MLPPSGGPVLAITHDVENINCDELGGLWTVITKCKESLQDGRRLENISWRLWYRHLSVHNHHPPKSPVPDTLPALESDSESFISDSDSCSDQLCQISPAVSSTSTAATSHNTAHDSACSATPTRLPTQTNHSRRSHSHSHTTRPPTHSVLPSVRLNESHRANSAPSRIPANKYHVPAINVGKIINTLLPFKITVPPHVLHSSDGMTSEVAKSDSHSTQVDQSPNASVPSVHLLTPVPESPSASTMSTNTPTVPPHVVIEEPTPLPTPHDSPSPQQSSNSLRDSESEQPQQHMTEITSAITPVACGIEDTSNVTGRKKKTFFFKESPGQDDAAVSDAASSASSDAKTLLAPGSANDPSKAITPVAGPLSKLAMVNAAHDSAVATTSAQPPVTTSAVRTNPSGVMSKKGKEPVRQATIPPTTNPQLAQRHGRPLFHGRARPTTLHRTHSTAATNTLAKNLPGKSKSAIGLSNLIAAAAANAVEDDEDVRPPVRPAPVRRTSSSSQKKPTSTERRGVSQEKQLPKATEKKTVVLPPVSKGKKPVLTSEAETTDTDGDDSSWASDYSDEDDLVDENSATGHIALAATEAARQRDMFAKVPTRSYTDLSKAKARQPGLLTTLFNPDPSILPLLPTGPGFRPHSSAQNLVSRPPLPHRAATSTHISAAAVAANSGLQTSKSSAALPLAAQVTVSQVGSNTSGRPGYRLKGRPKDLEVESSDDEDEGLQLSKSVAQKQLEKLAGLARRKSEQKKAAPQQPPAEQPTHPLRPTRSEQHVDDGGLVALQYTPSAPITLPHPYNLPAPAPPATPRTTRREMLATEMSESLRRQILWERETNRRMLRRRAPGGGVLGGLRPLTTTATAEQTQQQQQRLQKANISRNWSDDFHAAGW